MTNAIERQIALPIKIGGPIISPKPIDKLIKIADIRNLSEDQKNSITTDIVLCKNTTNGHYSFLIKSENERFHFDKELYSNDENSPKKKISFNEEIFFNQEEVFKKYDEFMNIQFTKSLHNELVEKKNNLPLFKKTLFNKEYNSMKELIKCLKNPTTQKESKSFSEIIKHPKSINHHCIINCVNQHLETSKKENVLFEKANAISKMINTAIDSKVKKLGSELASAKNKNLIFDKVITYFNFNEKTKERINPQAASLSTAHHVANQIYKNLKLVILFPKSTRIITN